MSAERLEQLFSEALQVPPSERLAFLERSCAGDADLLQRLQAMVALEARAERLGFLNPKAAPAAGQPNGTETLAAPSAPREGPGQVIGRYKILEQIGEGGCGVVYVAEQEKPLRRRVALKIIKPGMDSRAVIARFEAERQALAMMDHPNIAKVFDAGTTDAGRPYFVMELVRGTRITEYCDRAKLAMPERLQLFIEVCGAVQHAHQKAIIHRDLKPANILVALHDGVPVPKVIDFGIAKAIEGRLTDMTVYTHFQQFIGTPAYMSPEQMELSNVDIDTRSDIYSLGVLLYELLTGKAPFVAEDLLAMGLEQMSRTIREIEPPRPSTRLQTMPAGELATTAQQRRTEAPQLLHQLRGDLDWIVMKCLEKDRRRRYDTANALAMEIRRYLHHEPVIARPPTAIYKLQKSWRRNKGLYAASASVATALVAGLAAALLGLRTANLQQQWLEQNLYAADMAQVARDLDRTNRVRAFNMLDKYRPKAGQADDLRGWEWRYLRNRCEDQELFTLPGHPGRTHALVFSQDSQTLVSGGIEGQTSTDGPNGVVRIWDLSARRLVKTLPIGRRIYGLAIAPDGQALFIGWPDDVAVYAGPSFARATRLPGAQGPLALSPDGRMLVTGGRNGPIVWDAVSLIPLHQSSGHHGFIPDRTEICFSPDGSVVAIPAQRDGPFDIVVWNTEALRQKGFEEAPVSVLQRGGNPWTVHGFAFSTDGQILATGETPTAQTGWKGVELWDPKTGRLLRRLEASVPVLNLEFLPDGKTLLAFGWDQHFRLWDISTPTNLALPRVVPGHEDEIWSVAVAPDRQMVASGSKDGMIKVWDVKVFQEPPRVKDRIEAPEIAELVFSQDGRTMYSMSLDGAFTSWDAATLERGFSANLARRSIVARFSPHGTNLALGLTNGAVELWRVDRPNSTPRFSQELLPPQPEVSRPFFTLPQDNELSPSGPLLTWSGNGKTLAAFVNELYVWDIAEGRSPRKPSLKHKPDGIALSPDGSILAAAAGLNIQLWDLKSDRPLSSWNAHRERCNHLAFSPDGTTLASGSSDNTAALWDVPSGKRRWPATGQRLAVTHLEFSPDGRTVVIRGLDDTLRFRHVQTGRELMAIEGLPHGGGAEFGGVRFSADGALMAVGVPGQIRFFRAPALAELDAAERARGGEH